MVEVFKRLNVKVSCLGNHDTDFGLIKMVELIEKTEIPWIISNLYFEGKIIGNLPRSHILIHNGIKIGFFGLCEWEWLGILNPWEVVETLEYVDFKKISQ